jgi:hypothetical protein
VTLSLAWPPGGVLVPLPRRPVVGDASSRFTACERSLKPVWPRPNAGANAETHPSPVPPLQSPSVPGEPFGRP